MADRSQWRGWGAELTDDDFACAVAASIAQQALGVEEEHLRDAIRERCGPTAEPIIVTSVNWQPGSAQSLRDIWQEALGTGSGPRFAISPGFREDGLEEWLARPAVRASSVYFNSEIEAPVAVWNWPLRIGILPGCRPEDAKEIIAGVHWKDLVEVVTLDAKNTECEILLLPAGLVTAATSILPHRTPLRAGSVLVMGLADDPKGENDALLELVRKHTEAGAVGLLGVTREERRMRFNELVRELAHDQPFDAALFKAARAHRPQPLPPRLVASPRLLQASRLSTSVDSLATELTHPLERHGGQAGAGGPQEPPLVRDLREQTADMTAESIGATNFVKFKRSLPHPLQIPRRRSPSRQDRKVVAHTFSGDGREERSTLTKEQTYGVAIRIGYPHGREVGVARFRDELLPQSDVDHTLRVVFSELPQDDSEETRQPQTSTIVLPSSGDSSEAVFYFHTGTADAFNARVIFLYENRILQTLLYGAKTNGESPITFAEELDIYDFTDLDLYERFDAAIVVNKSGRRMGVTSVSDEAVKYTAPAGLENEIITISSLLSQLTNVATLPKTISDASLIDILYKLANRGHVLWQTLDLTTTAPRLAKASRVHVVAARAGELLPVEFLYPRAAPRAKRLCRHGAPALLSGDLKARCEPVRLDEICPTEFWSFNRVIEHVSFSDRKHKTPRGGTLNVFEKALVGISKNVTKRDAQKLIKALSKLTTVVVAKDWKDWELKIATEEPSLLVLLPHSEQNDPDTDLPALEIGGTLAPVAWIDERFVGKNGFTSPTVLLFGCTTTVTDLPFQNFAEAFKRHAAVVIGTLSIVLGRHAAPFAIGLLEMLHKASGRGTAKLGDVLLDIKRRRIAAGDPFALSLIAYGDASIRI
jgi:hypothetical protein